MGPLSRTRLSVDRDRVIALLSVAAGKPVAPDGVMPHIEGTCRFWERGEKALANLRLVIGRLPATHTTADYANVGTAGLLIDGGLSPGDLMEAL